MPRLRSLAAAAVGISAALLAVAGPASPGSDSRASAQTPPRTVTVEDGPLTPNTMATVSWTGFTPNAPAYVYLCRAGPTRPQDCYGQTLVTGRTGANGEGSAEFLVRSALWAFQDKDGNTYLAHPGGSTSTVCRPSICSVLVTECSTVVAPTLSASDPYELVPGVPTDGPGTYNDDPFAAIVWTEDEDGSGGYYPSFIVPREFPEPEVPPEPPGVRATGPRILGAGSDLGGAVHDEWGRAIAVSLDTTVNNTKSLRGYVDGINGVIDGSVDFAYSATRATPEQLLPADATPEQRAEVAASLQSLVYVPLSVSTIAVGYNAYPLLPMRDVRISARSLSAILWKQQEASTVGSGPLGADQGRCAPLLGRESILYSVADNSEANISASSFLNEPWDRRLPPTPWKFGVIDDVLPNNDTFQPMSNHESAPAAVMTPKGTGQTALAFGARFGLMDTTWALDHGDVPLAYLQNNAGGWVQPSVDGALKTLATSTIGADNVVDIDELSADPAAYPLVVVNYAIAPTTISDDFTATDAEAVRNALGFMISTEGQRLAAEEGFVPLTADLTIRGASAIEQIGSIVPQPPATTTTVPPTTAAATTTPTTPPDTTPSNQPTGGASNSRPNNGGAATPSATRTNPPANPGSNAPTGATGAIPPPSPATGAIPTANTDAVADSGLSGAPPAQPEESPPDFFDSLFDAVPPAPDLPVLGAAGATMAVAGQGLNLWRVSRKRPPHLGP